MLGHLVVMLVIGSVVIPFCLKARSDRLEYWSGELLLVSLLT